MSTTITEENATTRLESEKSIFARNKMNQAASAVGRIPNRHRSNQLLERVLPGLGGRADTQYSLRPLRRGLFYIFIMLVIAGLTAPVSRSLSIAAICLTGTLILATTLAFWMENRVEMEKKRVELINPKLTICGILLTLGLALVALSELIVW